MEEHILKQGYEACAKSLVEFGYPDATSEMVKKIHDAWLANEKLPHGVVGLMAQGQFEDYPQIFGEANASQSQ